MTNATGNFRATMNYKLTNSMEHIGLVADVPSNLLLLPLKRVCDKLTVAKLFNKSSFHLL
jgi:hypothetical protein